MQKNIQKRINIVTGIWCTVFFCLNKCNGGFPVSLSLFMLAVL
jgi:hypothetical protein